MKTPIYDFVNAYSKKGVSRFHMPGHKGRGPLGVESLDITEIPGADALYSADGIIEESENYASCLFGTAHTFYSTEGASLVIKAMLALAVEGKRKPKVLAARGAHKAFVYAAALIDADVAWIFPENAEHICDTRVSPRAVALALDSNPDAVAVYLTSPDYLGNISDVKGISLECKKRGVKLLVDNAHGAYLNFLPESCHPIALGADMCCDSAHKTLPVLTGGAYLHVSKSAPSEYVNSARYVLSVFASTSPSYLILSSLDLCNKALNGEYSAALSKTVSQVTSLKSELSRAGFSVADTEPLKIVINTSEYGYTGDEVMEYLRGENIEIEYFDSEYVVLMPSPSNTDEDFSRLSASLKKLPKLEPIKVENIRISTSPEVKMSIRDAIFASHEQILCTDAKGRICASPLVSCPPAVPIVVSGEVICEEHIPIFLKYNVEKIEVVKND